MTTVDDLRGFLAEAKLPVMASSEAGPLQYTGPHELADGTLIVWLYADVGDKWAFDEVIYYPHELQHYDRAQLVAKFAATAGNLLFTIFHRETRTRKKGEAPWEDSSD